VFLRETGEEIEEKFNRGWRMRSVRTSLRSISILAQKQTEKQVIF
jgi:hypothetical protein